MRWVGALFVLLFFVVPAEAGLQYLERHIVAETAFESVSNDFHDDYHTSNTDYDDSVDRDVSIGFNFPFKGVTYNSVNINSNGVLYFNSKNNTEFRNQELPYSDIEQSIYPYWDDLNLGGANDGTQGKVTYGTKGNAPNRYFIVHWDKVWHYGSSSKKYSFQVVLYEDGSIRFRYDASSDADGTSYNNSDPGATIGVQEDTSHYDQYSYNTTMDPHKDVLYTPIQPPSDNDYSDFHFDELSWNGTAGEVRDSHWDKHGTGHNVPSVKGKICQAMDLRADGTNDYAELGAGALDGVGDFTISVWHKGTSGNSRELLSGANSSHDNEAGFWYDNSTRFNPDYYQSSVGQTTSPNINDGSWHHLVWRVNGNQSCYFFDGQSQGCKNIINHTLSIEKLILGQDQDSVGGGFAASQDWEGIIDELLIFRKALNDNQVQSIYNNQNAGKNWDGSTRTCPYPTITKTSCVISDPVNNTSNPKRIPGAKIRYAIEVSNPNYSSLDDVKAEDTLDSNFDASTITTPKVKSSVCGECKDLSGGSNSGTISSNKVTVDFGTVDGGGSLSNPKKECGYFEVDIK